MSSQNTFFDLASFVHRYMAEGISSGQFVEGKAFGGVLTFTNAHCIIYLENFGEAVGFTFASTDAPDVRYNLSDYLDAFIDGGNQKYCPKPPQGMDIEQQFIGDLLGYNSVLNAGLISAPLSGDFSWVPRLTEFLAEYEMLDTELYKLLDIDEAKFDPIWNKKSDGDLTWMDDVRRILAEQES